MARKWKKFLSLLLTVAMLLCMVPTVLAAPPGGPGGGMPGMPGGSSAPVDLSGMLALDKYVFVGGTVSAKYYGTYVATNDDTQAAYKPTGTAGELKVWQDKDMTVPAAGVTAAVNGGTFTMSGTATEGNVVYYVSSGEKSYATIIYVVNDEYKDNTATLTLPDGSTLDLTTYAPNMAQGNYTAKIDQNLIDGNSSVYLGGNRTAVSLSDLTDTANYSSNEAAAKWWLTSSGVTNGGATMTTFGDTLYRFEYTVAIYRMFQIESKVTTTTADFEDVKDYVGAMMQNDQFSDAISATVYAGIWNGIYTKMSDTVMPGTGATAYLLTNIDETTRTMSYGKPVDVEFVYVGLYNALTSKWSTLNAQGEKVAADLAAAAAKADGETVSAPADYTNAAKISAVASVLLGQSTAPAADKALSKIEAIAVLYAAKDLVTSKTSPDSAFAAKVGTPYADFTKLFEYSNFNAGHEGKSQVQIFEGASSNAAAALNGKTVISTDNTAVLLNNAGTVSLTNSTFGITDSKIGSWSTGDPTDSPVAIRDMSVSIDGGEAPGTPMSVDPAGGGYVYNAMGRNAYYHDGVGAGIAVWGKSILNLTSDNGTLVLSGSKGSMSGTAYAGFGATININNAVAYSTAQHLTNILYNGTVHYKDSYAIGSGRLFSSDVWGAYQVFENTVGDGGNVTDEPTTIIAKNAVYGNSIGGNGYASQYFENSVLNVGSARFADKTSLITDVASVTLVNSVLNNNNGTLISVDGGENAIVTLVDSEIDLPGNTLATIASWDTINHPAFVTENPAVAPLFHSDLVIKLYGDNAITTSDGTLTASVAEGATLTIYGNVVDAKGNEVTIPGATIVKGAEYGTLTVSGPVNPFTDVVAGQYYYDAVLWAVEEGITNGTSATTFGPNAPCTRGQVVTFLYRAAGSPAVSGSSQFTDVVPGSYYADAVVWAVENGITNGTSDTTFSPNAPCTRGQVVTFLYRYADSPAANGNNQFTDVVPGSYYADAVDWALENGITNGTGDTTFSPNAVCTRGQIVTFLYRDLANA